VQPPSEQPSSNETLTSETTANTSNSVRSGKLVLLQTTRAVAFNDDTGSSINVRILFDTGSQRSYETDVLVRHLNLKLLKMERLQLNAFGEVGFRVKTCELVKIHLRALGTDEVVQLQALQFPTICSSVPNSVNLNDFPKLLSLDLANPPSSE